MRVTERDSHIKVNSNGYSTPKASNYSPKKTDNDMAINNTIKSIIKV